jgi:poly-gamma-glutamate synthesis protein (capsule biosynthesis protein)
MINIIIAGDYCPQSRVAKLAEKDQFEDIFGDIKPLLHNSDYSVVNFECPVVIGESTPIMSGGRNLYCTPKAVDALKYAGFNMVTLANNHFRDFGDKGVHETLETCKQKGIATVGGGNDIHEAQKYNNVKIKNKRFAFVNFCETEFSIATDTNGGSNPLNPVANYYQITEARKNADYVIVIVHGGHEYFQFPSPRMKQTYRFFIDIGADVILNHHQHCYSGYEVYHDKPIFYGLGNFCFDSVNKRKNTWYEGLMVSLSFEESVINFQLHPFTQCKIETNTCLELMTREQKDDFFNQIQMINSIIAAENLLKSKFIENANKMRDLVLLAFEPYTNKYLRSLRLHKLIPSVITNKKKVIMGNVITCESYRDITTEMLKIR